MIIMKVFIGIAVTLVCAEIGYVFYKAWQIEDITDILEKRGEIV